MLIPTVQTKSMVGPVVQRGPVKIATPAVYIMKPLLTLGFNRAKKSRRRLVHATILNVRRNLARVFEKSLNTQLVLPCCQRKVMAAVGRVKRSARSCKSTSLNLPRCGVCGQ